MSRDYTALANQYAQDILDGTIPAGKITKLAVQRNVADLARAAANDSAFPYVFSAEAGNKVCRYIEMHPFIDGGRDVVGKKITLEPWQCFVVTTVFGWLQKLTGYRRFRRAYIEVAKGNGKALALDTIIPTPLGMRSLSDIHAGDEVLDASGKPTVVIAESEIFTDHTCYEVEFSTGEVVVADAGHLWETGVRVLNPGGGHGPRKGSKHHTRTSRFEVRTTQQILDTLKFGKQNINNHTVRVSAAVALPERDYTIAPYALGVWLGDGNSVAGKFTNADPEVVYMMHMHEEVSFRCKKGQASDYFIGDSHRKGCPKAATFQGRLRSLGVLGNKHIPKEYLLGSYEQRMELLRGLMDTDGTASKGGQLDFVNCNERLARDVKSLICSLGFKASFTNRPAKLYGRVVGTAFKVSFFAYSDVPVFHIPRKSVRQNERPAKRSLQNVRAIVAVRPTQTVPVKCLVVDNPEHLFLITDGHIPTHNSCVTSPICNYMAFADGEPGSQVYSAATTRDQAKIIFDIACKMLRGMESYRTKAGIEFTGGEIVPTAAYQLRTNSNFKPLSSDADSSEGIKPHFIAVDELHAHAKRDLYDNLDTANGKMRGSMLWAVTTAGTNRGSVCYEQHMFIRDILEGRSKDETTFGIIYTIDADDSPWDETAWRKANPNWHVVRDGVLYGSVDPEEIKQKAAKAKQLPSAQNAFLTKHLNVWCNADTAGLPMADWDACCDTSLKIEDFAEDECIPGIDLASRLDLASVVKVFRRTIEGKHHFYGFQTSWLPQEAIDNSPTASLKGWVVEGCLEAMPGKTVDIATVIPEHLETLSATYTIKEIALDPAKSQIVVPGLEKIFGEEKLVTVSPKGAEMCPAMKELETLLIERRFHHSGDPLYTWAIGNVGGHVSQRDSSVFPVKKNAHAKIDPAIATMIALRRWTAYNEESQEHYSLSVVTL